MYGVSWTIQTDDLVEDTGRPFDWDWKSGLIDKERRNRDFYENDLIAYVSLDIKPDAAVILCNGFGDIIDNKKFKLPSIKGLLKKPCPSTSCPVVLPGIERVRGG